VGILLPGDRVSAVSGKTVTFRDGADDASAQFTNSVAV
jgi:hypothetical protein